MVKTFNRSDLQLSRRQKQIIADMDKKGFSESVKDMPLSAKLAFPFFLVGFLFAAPFTFKREDFFTLSEDTPDVESSNFFERCFGHYFKYILEDRDEFLKLTLRNQIEICHGHDLSICVQYGQRHMKALVDFLQNEMGYRLAEKREVLAVSKTKKMSLKGLQTGYGQAFAAYKFLPSNMSEEHQKYDRKMTSVESKKAALDKMSARRVARERVRLAQSSYAFSKDDIMNAWTARASGGAMGYNLLVGRKKLVSDEDLQLDNLNDVEDYSLDVKYSAPSYSIRNSKPGSSPENPIKIDDSLVFVIKPNKDAA